MSGLLGVMWLNLQESMGCFLDLFIEPECSQFCFCEGLVCSDEDLVFGCCKVILCSVFLFSWQAGAVSPFGMLGMVSFLFFWVRLEAFQVMAPY